MALPTHSTLECDKAPKHFLQHTTINSPIVRLWLLWRRSVECWQSVQDNAVHGALIRLCCSPQYPCPYLVTTLCVPSLLHTSTKRMHMVHISQLSFYRSLASIHFYSEKLSGLSEPKVVHCWESCLCRRNLGVLTIMGSGSGCQRSEAWGTWPHDEAAIFHISSHNDTWPEALLLLGQQASAFSFYYIHFTKTPQGL